MQKLKDSHQILTEIKEGFLREFKKDVVIGVDGNSTELRITLTDKKQKLPKIDGYQFEVSHFTNEWWKNFNCIWSWPPREELSSQEEQSKLSLIEQLDNGDLDHRYIPAKSGNKGKIFILKDRLIDEEKKEENELRTKSAPMNNRLGAQIQEEMDEQPILEPLLRKKQKRNGDTSPQSHVRFDSIDRCIINFGLCNDYDQAKELIYQKNKLLCHEQEIIELRKLITEAFSKSDFKKAEVHNKRLQEIQRNCFYEHNFETLVYLLVANAGQNKISQTDKELVHSIHQICLKEKNYKRMNFMLRSVLLIGMNSSKSDLMRRLHIEIRYLMRKARTPLSENTIFNMNLTTLFLHNRAIGDDGAIEISTTNTNLTTLCLYNHAIGDHGVIAISKNTSWTNLTTLDLQNNSIGADGAVAMSRNPIWTKLTNLYLGDNSIGADGASAISKNTTWNNLTTLYLYNNGIGTKGAITISENTTWTNLITLNLYDNSICDDGAIAISKNTTWTNLGTLNLGGNSIGDQGAIAISKNPTWTKLTTLGLSENRIGAEGAVAISENTIWTNLITLYLGYNSIGDEGVIAISKNPTWTKLTTLGLSENKIGVEGAVAISENTIWTNLTALYLGYNGIGAKGAIAISKNPTWTHLTTLDLRSNWIGDQRAMANLEDYLIGAENSIALKKRWPKLILQ